MAKTNDCLRRTFTFFNIIFAIVGGIVLAIALWAQFSLNSMEFESKTMGLIMLYVTGCITLLIAVLGAYGAVRESRGCLIAFLVFMVLGTLGMFRGAIRTALVFPVEDTMREDLRHVLPLDKAPELTQDIANRIQESLQCCGLFSYKDWEGNIPDSCSCDPDEGVCQNIKHKSHVSDLLTSGPRSVYAQTCFPLLVDFVDMFMQICLGVTLTFAILSLLGMILSSILIHQLRSVSRPTLVLSVPTVFAPQPPKYQELYNTA